MERNEAVEKQKKELSDIFDTVGKDAFIDQMAIWMTASKVDPVLFDKLSHPELIKEKKMMALINKKQGA